MCLKLLADQPDGFPDNASPPKFLLGDRVLLMPDFGTITGIEYALAEHLEGWGWRYVIQLDDQSPSYQWVSTDLAWEDDLQLFPLTPCRIGAEEKPL